jgi:hypothetical protein
MELTEGNRKRMFGKIMILLSFALLWLLPLAQSVEADYDYELGFYHSGVSEYRDAADAADLIERGQASVTDSPQFRDGIRLTTWAAEEEGEFEPGLASALYYFGVPSWTHYLKITMRYRDVSNDDDIAGRLWIKTVDGDQAKVIESEEETLLYGDTFVLRSDRTSEVIYVPSGRHVEDGTVEVHIVASGRDSLDVNYIRVEYLKKKPKGIKIVHHSYDDYWYRWPPYRYGYHYFYWGPSYWPRTSLIYAHWIWPHSYYWHTYRPWYRIHMVKYHHRYPHWYRRYSHTYRADSGHSRLRKRILLHRWPKKRRVRMERRREYPLPNHHASGAKGQATRRSARSKSEPLIPRRTTTKKIAKEGRKPTAMKKIERPGQDRRRAKGQATRRSARSKSEPLIPRRTTIKKPAKEHGLGDKLAVARKKRAKK